MPCWFCSASETFTFRYTKKKDWFAKMCWLSLSSALRFPPSLMVTHLCRSPTEPMREVTLKQSVKVNPWGFELAIERVISHKSLTGKDHEILGIYFISTIPWHYFLFHGCFLDFQGELYPSLSSPLHPYAWQTEVKTLAMTIWKVVLSLRCFPCLLHSGSQSRKQFHTPPDTTYTKVQTIQKILLVFFFSEL